jgi:aspartokinase/homoserine dehydrogenase 1
VVKQQDLQIWKFGGASLADAAAIRHAADLVAAHRGPLVVVASAMAGVTDLLIGGARAAAAGRAREAARAAGTFAERHRRAVAATVRSSAARRTLRGAIEVAAQEYRDLCTALGALGHIEPRAHDFLVARGERVSASILAAALAPQRGRYVDAVEIIRTDDLHGGAMPDAGATRRLAVARLRPLLRAGAIPIVPGFIGAAPDGSVATLGRGGSDLTATTLARALGSRTVVLWKDVAGLLTADPHLVPDARLIPWLRHREAAEMAHYGAKVLHPRALIPIAGSRVVLHLRSFQRPGEAGTEISAHAALASYPVKALAVLPQQAVVTVSGKGMIGVPGVAARTFEAVHGARLSVSTIFQSSSESSIGFTLPAAEADTAVRYLRAAFKHELDVGLIDGVGARSGMSVVAVVGEGMAGTPGIAARVFSALADGGVNVVAIAQGSSERNISFVVRSEDAADAARRVHTAFQLSKIGGGRPRPLAHTDVVLLGFGRVGRALADQIAQAHVSPPVRLVGVVDRSGYVFDADGLSRARLQRLARAKGAGRAVASLGGRRASAEDALTFIASHAVSRPVVADVTGDETGPALRAALAQGFDVVLANKKPLAGPYGEYARLLEAARGAARRIRYEATVGAGLPIIDTFRKLDEAGDRVHLIEGCVSGTLMYVLSAVSAGRPFSEAVREAVARGYAEPDPRDDLSGRDAARKGLILARMIGYRGSSAPAESLVSGRWRTMPLAEFLRRLPDLDERWRRRVEQHARRGRVLRYVVRATPRGVEAGLVAVPAAAAVAAAAGTRNVITFHSRRYRAEPLVISGPGAGPEVTAAGILNDICSL